MPREACTTFFLNLKLKVKPAMHCFLHTLCPYQFRFTTHHTTFLPHNTTCCPSLSAWCLALPPPLPHTPSTPPPLSSWDAGR